MGISTSTDPLLVTWVHVKRDGLIGIKKGLQINGTTKFGRKKVFMVLYLDQNLIQGPIMIWVWVHGFWSSDMNSLCCNHISCMYLVYSYQVTSIFVYFESQPGPPIGHHWSGFSFKYECVNRSNNLDPRQTQVNVLVPF